MAKYQIGLLNQANLNSLNNRDLIAMVEKAAKTANARLRSLEKAGFTSGIYRSAMADLGLPRKRFHESAKTLTRQQLLHEAKALRSFLTAQTSTVRGQNQANRRRYKTAVQRGFKGSEEAFYAAVERFYTKHTERLFSSDVIYMAITEGTTDTLDAVLQECRGKSEGEALLEYLARK